MLAANGAIAIGVLLVALGGIVGTWGWNQRDLASARAGMIESLHNAVNLTIAKLQTPLDNHPEKLERYIAAEPVQTSMLEAVLGSQLLGSKEHLELRSGIDRALGHIVLYNTAVSNRGSAWRSGPDIHEHWPKAIDELRHVQELLVGKYGAKD